MSRTSFYLSMYEGNPQLNQTSTFYDDELFLSLNKKEKRDVINLTHQKILDWLQECSETTPNLMNGIDKSIVSWFIQSAYLLPGILHIEPEITEEISENYQQDFSSMDISDVIKFLIKNNVISQETRRLLKNTINSIPAPEIVWKILEDIHNYALEQTNVTVPLTRAMGDTKPIIFPKPLINQFLQRLHLPELPLILDEKTPFYENSFKNGRFLLDLYSSLTGERKQLKVTTVPKETKQNIGFALSLLIQANFIDESFSKCIPSILKGDIFLLQQIISLIMFNAKPVNSGNQSEHLEKSESNQIESESSKEKMFVKSSMIKDGISLVKLLTCIDVAFTKVDCLFSDPENDIEKKWNVRKALEYLYKKEQWPNQYQVDSSLLISGEMRTANLFYQGMIECYPNKFASLSAIMNLKKILGLDTNKI